MMMFAFLLGAALSSAPPNQPQPLIFNDDFETRDFSAWTSTPQATPDLVNANCPPCGTIVTSPVHSGNYAFSATMSSAGGVKVSENVGSVSSLDVRFYFYLAPSWSEPDGGSVAVLTISGAEQVRFYNKAGSIYLRDNNGQQGTHAIARQMWHSLEVRSVAGSGTGTATVWLDGSVEIEAANLNVPGPFSIFYMGVDNFGTATGTIYFDDAAASTGTIGSPAANITARYPNTGARSALPVDLVMYGQSPGDQLSASMDGNTVYSNSSVAPHERFALNMAALSVGDHTLRISLRNSAGTEKASYAATLHKYAVGAPLVSIDANNVISLSGNKYFAITPFADGLDKWQPWLTTQSANTYGWLAGYENNYAYSQTEYKSFLDSLSGARAIGPDDNWQGRTATTYAADQPDAITVASGYVSYLKAHPSVFMWTWKDEPDIGPGLGHIPPPQMIALLQATHANDANHPVILNLAGYPNANVRNRRAGWHYPIVPDSTEMPADVYSFDMYPLIYQTQGYTVAQWVDQIERVKRYTYNLTPWYVFVEGGIQPCTDPPVCTGGHGPSAAQVSMEAWLAVIHGVKGISWWGPFAYIDSAHRKSMTAFTHTVSSLQSAILSSSGHAVTSDRTQPHTRVDVTGRNYNGSIYIFAARLTDVGEDSDPPLTANLTIAGYGSGTATVYGENRTVPIVNGVLTDVFAPAAVHIYIPGAEIAAP